jgi:hypothetical protein
MTNTDNDDVKEFTINNLIDSTNNYIIPIYQRNYAWTTEEVNQLLHDIKDMQETKSDKNYYIGTLVVSKQNGKFEVLDGQQRLTTFSIILSVLQNRKNLQNSHENINLHFDSRKDSSVALQNLWSRGKCNEAPMQNAYETINKFLSELGEESVGAFVTFLLEKVVIIRVTVPEHTDRNKYFETMHTRGEQLEKHEVLKARMMDALDKDNDAERHCFATIWDACADMTRFVQMSFDSNIRGSIFGNDANEIPSDFSALCSINTEGVYGDKQKLQCILCGLDNPSTDSVDHKNATQNTNSTSNKEKIEVVNIDFPNFLLHVLRIHVENTIGSKTGAIGISLDDKKLIEEFDNYLSKNYCTFSSSERIKKFAIDLLKCRMLFDKYIIKQHNEKDDWQISELQNKEGKYIEKNTFEKNKQLILLQSMFHVSFSSKSHKHWLNAALQYLYNCQEPIIAKDYLEHLESIAKCFVFNRILANKDDMQDFDTMIYGDNSIRKNTSCCLDVKSKLSYGKIQNNFIFNYLDYLLWVKESKKEKKDTRIVNFRFTSRHSVEHFYPQKPKQGIERLDDSILNSFGNLCLISHSKNSELSNYLPIAKKEHYGKLEIDSIKQHLMMQYDEWDATAINTHQEEMIDLLKQNRLT